VTACNLQNDGQYGQYGHDGRQHLLACRPSCPLPACGNNNDQWLTGYSFSAIKRLLYCIKLHLGYF
jgi:hypothetical protein